MLYSGESFSRSLRGLFHLPSRPLLSAAVMPMLLSKELSASSDGYSLFSFIQLILGTKMLMPRPKIQRPSDRWGLYFSENHLSPFTNIAVWERLLSLSTMFPVQVRQWRILTIIMETLCVKSNIIKFWYLSKTNNANQRILMCII